jgi:hypothetical protein
MQATASLFLPLLRSMTDYQTYEAKRGDQATRQEVFQDLDTLYPLSFLFPGTFYVDRSGSVCVDRSICIFGSTCVCLAVQKSWSTNSYSVRRCLRCLDSLLEVLLHVPCRLLGVSLTPIFVINPDDTKSSGESFLPYIISLTHDFIQCHTFKVVGPSPHEIALYRYTFTDLGSDSVGVRGKVVDSEIILDRFFTRELVLPRADYSILGTDEISFIHSGS